MPDPIPDAGGFPGVFQAVPRPVFQIAIVLSWLVTSLWFVNEEIRPLLQEEDRGYQSLLADRKRDVTTRWRILANGLQVGRAMTQLDWQQPERACVIRSVLELDRLGPPAKGQPAPQTGGPPQLRIVSMATVTAAGRLDQLTFDIQLPRAATQVRLDGTVEGQTIHCRLRGLEGVPGVPAVFDVPLEEEGAYLEQFTPADRMANLCQGRRWTTRTVNPLAHLPAPLRWLVGGSPIELIHHEVTGLEEVLLEGKSIVCYVVEHRRGNDVSRSWATVSDGTVIQRDFKFAGMSLRLQRQGLPEER